MVNRPVLAYGSASQESSLHVRSIVDFLKAYLKPHVTKRKSNERNKQIFQSIIDISSEYRLDFKESMHKQISFAINEIGSLPGWFVEEKYFERCWNNYNKYLESNKEIKKYMTKLNRRDITETEQKIDTVFFATNAIYESLKKSYPQVHKIAIIEFLDSDMPFDLYNLSNLTYLNIINAFDIMQKKTDRFQKRIHMVRGDIRKVRKEACDYERILQPMFLKLQMVLELDYLLKFYIKVSNANRMDDMFTVIPLTTEKLDKTKFYDTLDYYREKTFEFAVFLNREYNMILPSVNDVNNIAMHEFRNNIGHILVNYA